MKKLKGIPAAPGAVLGKAFLYAENEVPELAKYTVAPKARNAERKRLAAAIDAASAELRSLKARSEAGAGAGAGYSAILGAQLLMLDDPEFQAAVLTRFEETGFNMEWVVYDTVRGIMSRMAASTLPAFRERAADIHDVARRIIRALLGQKPCSLEGLDEDVIVVARDILPSELFSMQRSRVKAIVTEQGGATSHAAIIAKAFGIPAVLGAQGAASAIAAGDPLAVDADAGTVLVRPSAKALAAFREVLREAKRRAAGGSKALRKLPAETKDGMTVTLEANIGVPSDAARALDAGAEGIGLYRSEFLFIRPGAVPSEDEQTAAYRAVLEAMQGRPVTIRTLDAGGDKVLPEFENDADEKNPLLGWRAIRFSLARPAIFKTQLRALLRASVAGNLRILFPLVSGIEELEQALALLDEARAECRAKRQRVSGSIDIGVMIEVPSAALAADVLAGRADFFSIGTNDLVQYTLAVDRGNSRVGALAQPCHPGILRLLKMTVDAAHAKGIRAAMCGELAGDPAYTGLLLGLGIDSFSMDAQAIPRVKAMVRSLRAEDCRALAACALAGRGWQENAALLRAWARKHERPAAARGRRPGKGSAPAPRA
ncbi:MAG: phosphoenolpyruvate--protein phosphotransferase [Treponema sp.]|jgi:phosphotransferase system enzyme I (PtsI)|nr:phosphoenolpyruvate--protein phosphotransferase [Treponema sp.]